MSIRTQNYINGRLSLRAPQAESLAKLKQALDAVPEMAQKDRDVAAVLNTLKAEFPTLEDFEREFPSLCFALATGGENPPNGSIYRLSAFGTRYQ